MEKNEPGRAVTVFRIYGATILIVLAFYRVLILYFFGRARVDSLSLLFFIAGLFLLLYPYLRGFFVERS